MNGSFWVRIHGGATHFPIALVLASVLFDGAAFVTRAEARRREFRLVGFYLVLLAAVLSFGAIFSGLVLSRGVMEGTGLIARHHRFVWPAFALLQALAIWRLCVRDRASQTSARMYLAAALVLGGLMAAAGYWGGEILLAP